MTTIISYDWLDQQEWSAIIVPALTSYAKEAAFNYLNELCDGSLAILAHHAEFDGTKNSFFVHSTVIKNIVKTIILTGYSTNDGEQSVEYYRRALAKGVKHAQANNHKSIVVALPDEISAYMVEQTASIVMMASYSFEDFIAKKSQKSSFYLLTENTTFTQALNIGNAIGEAVNQARRWVDMPPSIMNPSMIVQHAQEIALQHKLSCTVFNEQEIIAMNMGGLAGVSAGSAQDCALIILEYRSSVVDAPSLALVGKGVTFDSGGLSIKPADAMEAMKDDMSGAAAVLNAMRVIAELKPALNIIALAPVTENLPSGTAIKPGDIVRFYNGKTAEVRNTDAEGRLILADALAYAVKHYAPDALIDLATLTGACVYALGPFFAGMMSQHPALSKKVEQAAQRSGDRVWPLPFSVDYKIAVKSSIADICNIGSRKYRAGAISAAWFLHEFVDEVPWVHLDIAGVAFDVPDISYYTHGATGFGVRLLIDLVRNWHISPGI